MDSLQEQSSTVADILVETINKLNALETTSDFVMVKARTITQLQNQADQLLSNAGRANLSNQQPDHDYSKPLTEFFGRKVGQEAAKTFYDPAVPEIFSKEKQIERNEANDFTPDPSALDGEQGNTMAPPVVHFQTAEEQEIAAIDKTVDELYPVFIDTETATIVDKYSDIEIRAVAKRAGLPVTERTPKDMNSKFVDKIKEAIKENNRIAAEGENKQ